VQFEKFRPSVARWSLCRACQAAGVEPVFADYSGDDALAFAVSLNLHRRHLSKPQREMAAAKIATTKHGGDRKSNQAAKEIAISAIPAIFSL